MPTVRVDVDLDDVIDEVSTRDLIAELKDRASYGDAEAFAVVGVVTAEARDRVKLEDALRREDWEQVGDLVRSMLDVTQPAEAIERRYRTLERDPVTGRPVIQ